MTTKACGKCKNYKDLTDFGANKQAADGLNSRCKPCKREADRIWREANAEKKRAADRQYAKDHAVEARERARLWAAANPERHQANRKNWYDNNQDRVKELRQRWKEEHEEEVRAYMNEYIKERYRSAVNYRVKAIVSSRMRQTMKNKEWDTTVMYLGCTMEEFREWIEHQFDPNMTWDNMGSYWTFDHVRPCASFDLQDEMQRHLCFNWSNVRPCESVENIKKKDKIILDLINAHEALAQTWRNNKMAYQD